MHNYIVTEKVGNDEYFIKHWVKDSRHIEIAFSLTVLDAIKYTKEQAEKVVEEIRKETPYKVSCYSVETP